MTSPIPQLRLYSRSYCHLCDDLLHALEALREELNALHASHALHADFSIEVVDVDSNPQWVERYDELVPVLVRLVATEDAGERELCHYFFDREAVIQGLK